jgi:hypothetical protein
MLVKSSTKAWRCLATEKEKKAWKEIIGEM